MKYPFQWLARRAKEQPDQIAIVYHDQENVQKSLDYKEFDQSVSKLAMLLRQKYPPHTVVGVCLERNHEYLICMYAIWKAGMIYMPFSDSFKRINKDIIASHLAVAEKKYDRAILLTNYPSLLQLSKYAVNYASFRNGYVNDNYILTTSHTLLTPAYICCSSGTTDKPKLILNTYEGFEDRVKGLADQLMPDNFSQQCILGFSAYDFDASLLDSMMAVYRGASYYVVPHFVRKNPYIELPKLFQLAHSQNRPITVAVLLPSVLSGIDGKGLDPAQYPGIESLVTMGDVCKDVWLIPWLKKIRRVFNGYGPTEATIAALLALLNGNSDSEIPLGKPLPGVTIYLVDSDIKNENAMEVDSKLTLGKITKETSDEELLLLSQQLQQKVCEIYISGTGIGKYLHDEKADKENFINHTKQHKNRTYVSKDLAYLREGKLIFKGRRDNLIKRNGVRVLLDDIKDIFRSNISNIDSNLLTDIFVLDIDKFVIACVISPQNTPNETLTEKLYACNERLEPHLRIDLFVRIEQPIINDRFKFKFNADLLKSAGAKLLCKQKAQPCKTPVEKALAKIWAELLIPEVIPQGKNVIQASDNFFELGGDSLDMSRLISKIWRLVLKKDDHGGISSDFNNFIYRNPVLRNMANYIETYQYPAAIEYKKEGDFPPFFYINNFGNVHKFLENPTTLRGKIYKLVPKQISELTTLTAQTLYEQCDNMLEQCIRSILSIQQVGPFQIISTQQDLYFTLALVNELKLSGMQTIFNVYDSEPSIKKEHALEYETTLLKWISENRGIRSESIKTTFQINYLKNNEFIEKLNYNWIKQQQLLIKYKLDKLYIQQQKQIVIPYSFLPYIVDYATFKLPLKNIDELLENFITQQDHKVLFIMGPHGVGKKTLLVRQALALWYKYQTDQNPIFLPIAINLRKSSSPTPLMTALQIEGFNENDYDILKTQHIIFFVYGYGEINRHDYPCLLDEISQFKSAKIILSISHTLAPALLTHTWNLKNCDFITLSPLPISHIKQRESDAIFLRTLTTLEAGLMPSITPLNIQLIKEMVMKKIRWVNHNEFLMKFLNYWLIREVTNNSLHQVIELSSILDYISKLPDRLTIRPLPSKWENKQLRSAEIVLYDLVKHPYFNFIKKLLVPYSENEFSLPSWLLQVTKLYKDKQQTIKIDLEQINNEILNVTSTSYLTYLLSPKELQNIIATNSSFVPINTGQYLSPVFFFHPLTGSSTGDYRNLARRLGPKQPVYCFAMSEGNDSYSENMITKVNYFANIIEKIQPTGEINLAGWSYGGLLLAFTAYILEQRGRKIGLAIIIDCSSPTAMREIPVGTRSFELLKALPALYKISKADLLSDDQLKQVTMHRFQTIDIWNDRKLTLTQYSDVIAFMFNYAIEHYRRLSKKSKDNRNLEQLIVGLTNSCINLKTCYHALDLRIILNSTFLHIAEPDHTPGINPGPDRKAGYLWDEIVHDKKVEVTPFEGSNHYTIFKNEEFITYFCNLVSKQQARLNCIPLEDRINSYIQQFSFDKNYVKTEATLTTSAKTHVDLCSSIIDSICKDEMTFLIHGASGAGKTTFLKYLLTNLNQLIQEKNLDSFLPIYVKAMTNTGDIITNNLKEQGFTENEINNDIKNRQIFLVIDGCPSNILNVNLFDFYELNKWPKLTVIFACRSNYLEKEFYKKSFSNKDGRLKEYYIPPLTLRSIHNYLDLYQKNNNIQFNMLLTDFNDTTQQHPELREQAANPMMLSMIVKILSIIKMSSEQNSKQHFWTKTDIQNNFISQTIAMTKKMLHEREGIPPGVDIEKALLNYYQQLAFALFEGKKISRNDTTFFDRSLDTQQLLNAPLLDVGKTGITFIHNTYYEFFVALALKNKMMSSQNNFVGIKQLISNRKNDPEFENIIIYLIGLLAEQNESQFYIKSIFDIICGAPNNLVGFNEHLLIMRCANEAKLPPYIRENKVLNNIINHYFNSILSESSNLEDYKKIFMNTLGASPYILQAFNILDLLYEKLIKSDEEIQNHLIKIISTIKRVNNETIEYLCNIIQSSDDDNLICNISRALGEIGVANTNVIQTLQSVANKDTKSRAECEEALWLLGINDTHYGMILNITHFDESIQIEDNIILKYLSRLDQVDKHASSLTEKLIAKGFFWVVTHNPADAIRFLKDIKGELLFKTDSIQNQGNIFNVPLVIKTLLLKFESESVNTKVIILKNLKYISSDRHCVKQLLLRAIKLPDDEVMINALHSATTLFPTAVDVIHNICDHFINIDNPSVFLASKFLDALGNIKFVDTLVLNSFVKAFTKCLNKNKALQIANKLINFNQEIIVVLIGMLKTEQNVTWDDLLLRDFSSEVCKVLGAYNLTHFLAYFADEDILDIGHANYQYLFYSTPLASLINYLLLTRFQIFANYIIGKSLYGKHNLHLKENSLCYYEYGKIYSYHLTNEDKDFCVKIFNECLYGHFSYLYYKKESLAGITIFDGIGNTNIDAKINKMSGMTNEAFVSLMPDNFKKSLLSNITLTFGFLHWTLTEFFFGRLTKSYISAIISENTCNDQLIFQLISDWTTINYCREWFCQDHLALPIDIEKMLKTQSYENISIFFAINILFSVHLMRIEISQLSQLNPPNKVTHLKDILLNELMLLIETARVNKITTILARAMSASGQSYNFQVKNILNAVYETEYNNHYSLSTGYRINKNTFKDIHISFIRDNNCIYILSHEINDDGSYLTRCINCWKDIKDEQLRNNIFSKNILFIENLISIKNKNRKEAMRLLLSNKSLQLSPKILETIALFNIHVSNGQFNTYQLGMLFRFIFDFGRKGVEIYDWIQHQIQRLAKLYVSTNQINIDTTIQSMNISSDHHMHLSYLANPLHSSLNQESILVDILNQDESNKSNPDITKTITDKSYVFSNPTPIRINYNLANILLLLRKQIADGIDAHIHYLDNIDITSFTSNGGNILFNAGKHALAMSIPTVLLINPTGSNVPSQLNDQPVLPSSKIFALVIYPYRVLKRLPEITIIDDSFSIIFSNEKDVSRKKLSIKEITYKNLQCEQFNKLMCFCDLIKRYGEIYLTVPTINLNINDRYACFVDEIVCEVTQVGHPHKREAILLQSYHYELLRTNNSNYFSCVEIIVEAKKPIAEVIEKQKQDKPQTDDNIKVSNIINAISQQDMVTLRNIINATPNFLTHSLQSGFTVFHALCELMSENDLESIITKHPLLNLSVPFAWHPTFLNYLFLQCAKEGKLDLLQRCLVLGADVRVKDKQNEYTPLHYLCLTQHNSIILLISKDPKINWSAQTVEGDTVFHHIVKSQNFEVLSKWLDNPVMDIGNNEGITPRDLMNQLNMQIPLLPQTVSLQPSIPQTPSLQPLVAKNPVIEEKINGASDINIGKVSSKTISAEKKFKRDEDTPAVSDKERVSNNLPNFSTTVNKLLDAIGKEINDAIQLGEVHISRGELLDSISNLDNYYSADFINLLLHPFNQKGLPIKVYPAITIEKIEEYFGRIYDQQETYAFIPLNISYNGKESGNKNHWVVVIIDKKHQLIFYLDPAQNTEIPKQIANLKIRFCYKNPIILNPINLQKKEKQEGWIRHCGVYTIEIFKIFAKYIQKNIYISDSLLAAFNLTNESISLQSSLSEIPCGEADNSMKIRISHIEDACKILGVPLEKSIEVPNAQPIPSETLGLNSGHVPSILINNPSSWFYTPSMRSVQETAKSAYNGLINYFRK